MLEKLLPSFWVKKKNLKSDQLNPSQQNQQNQELIKSISQNKAFLNAGLNLISGLQQAVRVPTGDKISVSRFRKTIIWISVVFGVLLLINSVLFFVLNSLKSQQDVLVKRVSTYLDIEKQAKNADRRLTYYKKIVDRKKNLAPKVDFVLKNLSSDINLKNLKVDAVSFRISADAPSPLNFTTLIASYLNGDTVSEIILRSANLNYATKRFEVDMEGKFK